MDMPHLAMPNPASPIIRLLLAETTIPSQAMPRSEDGTRLYLPTFVDIAIVGDDLCIEAILRPRDSFWWDYDDDSHPRLSLKIRSADILSLRLREYWGEDNDPLPAAKLAIRDPLGVQESLSILFAGTDANNPGYWLQLLAKLLNERFKTRLEDGDF